MPSSIAIQYINESLNPIVIRYPGVEYPSLMRNALFNEDICPYRYGNGNPEIIADPNQVHAQGVLNNRDSPRYTNHLSIQSKYFFEINISRHLCSRRQNSLLVLLNTLLNPRNLFLKSHWSLHDWYVPSLFYFPGTKRPRSGLVLSSTSQYLLNSCMDNVENHSLCRAISVLPIRLSRCSRISGSVSSGTSIVLPEMTKKQKSRILSSRFSGAVCNTYNRSFARI